MSFLAEIFWTEKRKLAEKYFTKISNIALVTAFSKIVEFNREKEYCYSFLNSLISNYQHRIYPFEKLSKNFGSTVGKIKIFYQLTK
jgi:hypothetical protein